LNFIQKYRIAKNIGYFLDLFYLTNQFLSEKTIRRRGEATQQINKNPQNYTDSIIIVIRPMIEKYFISSEQ
ncbi:hypothetical protein, partial [Vibrio parahaemolyticus]|uniref:hypothetical protein n=1 Tax=Vibrio parahaemolyticus TaxID=670 RepID=UPI00116D618A